MRSIPPNLSKKIRLLLAVVVCTISFGFTSCKTVETKQPGKKNSTTVEAIGKAQIFASGQQNAFNAALDEAFRNAIEEVLGNQLRSEVKVVDGTLQRDAILSVVSGYVESYELIADNNVLDRSTGAYVKEVTIFATILLNKLKKDVLAFQLLHERLNLPAVAVEVRKAPQQNLLSISAAKALESTAKGFFVEQGYFLVDNSAEVAGRENIFQPDLQVVFSVGIQENSVVGVQALENSGLQSATLLGELLLRVKSSGEVIFSQPVFQPGVGLSPQAAAVNAAIRVKAILKKADVALMKYLDYTSNNGRNILVSVGGLNANQSVELSELISPNTIEGVSKAFNKGYIGGRHFYVVRHFGDANALGEKIVEKSGNALKLVAFSSNFVTLEVY